MQRFAIFQPFLQEGVPLAQIARDQGISLRTLRHWVRQYRRAGLAGLARKPRGDRGRRRLLPQVQQLIEGLALQRPQPTAATIHRKVSQVAAEQGWHAPSYRTVAAIVYALDPSLVTLAHAGANAYRETFDLLYRREAGCANEIWQADHTLLDVWVRADQGDHEGIGGSGSDNGSDNGNRANTEGGKSKLVRPWLTVILDDYSRAVASYRLSTQAPSAFQTALALRDAIWRKADPRWHVCGIPTIFYTDHGSDFTSQHMEQVAVDLKMVLIFSMAGRPRGRGRIERFFQSVNQLFLSSLPGYTPTSAGSGVGVPPPRTSPHPALTLGQLDQGFRSFLLDDYHSRVHSETGIPPQERWEASGFLPQLPSSLEQLDLLLLTVAKSRTVQQDGIHFQGLRYLDLTLAAYVGEMVVIRYDPVDLAEIRVYHENRFLCRAVCQELTNQTISLKEIVQARTQRRKQVRDDLKERTSIVDHLLRSHRIDEPPAAPPAAPPADVAQSDEPRLKRYINE